MQEKLTKLWKSCETRQLAKIFKQYMESIEVKPWDGRKKDNRNSYYADGKSENWNRIQCHYYKEMPCPSDENLLIVLRKRAGSYLIIGKGNTRAFEIDYRGILHYEENLLKKIMDEHKPLFEVLFETIK